MPGPTSKAQAGLFGAIAAGKKTKATGMSPEEARKRLRGAKVSKLPKRVRKRGRKDEERRSGGAGGGTVAKVKKSFKGRGTGGRFDKTKGRGPKQK